MKTLSRRVSRRGLRRALAQFALAVGLLVGVYVGLARSGVVHSPLFVTTEGDVEQARGDDPGLRVLFVGNSFTFYNDMPRMLHELAAEDSDSPSIFSVARTRGGWTLEDAADDSGLGSLLEDVQWDAVILQEQSQMLSYSEDFWLQESYPYADELRRKIEATGAKGILFMTWGYEHGNDESDSYEAMQLRLGAGYADLARKLGFPIAPVGLAWYNAHQERPELDLWDGDGRHPNRAGSYLAACVFYKELTGRDPAGNGYTASLTASDVRFLQDQAADAVAEFEALAPGLSVRLVERAGA